MLHQAVSCDGEKGKNCCLKIASGQSRFGLARATVLELENVHDCIARTGECCYMVLSKHRIHNEQVT